MNGKHIQPEKITKPFQFNTAMMVVLFSATPLLLHYASGYPVESWVSAFLNIAAVLNIPFIAALLYRLQTKHRSKLAGDEHYSDLWKLDFENRKPSPKIIAQSTNELSRIRQASKEVIKTIKGEELK